MQAGHLRAVPGARPIADTRMDSEPASCALIAIQ